MMNPPLRSRFATPRSLCLSLAALAVVGLTAAAPAPADTTEIQRSVSVEGEAERRVAPDMAVLRIEVQIQAAAAAEARRDADATTLRALQTLRDAGISDADIDSTALSINPQYRWLKEEQQQELTGYRVSRSITARLLELGQLGALLEALSDAGVNRVQPPMLGVADDEAVQRELLSAATVNARERAMAIAAALGASLGEVLSVSAHGGSRPVPLARENMMMAADNAASPAPGASYNAGDITFRAAVSASFALQ